MGNQKKSSHKKQKMESLGGIFLLILMGYIFIFSISVEIIGRLHGTKEIQEYFTAIEKEVQYIYRTDSKQALETYLDDLVVHPYVKYAICYENDKPRKIHTKEIPENFEEINIFKGTRVNIDVESILLEGYIVLEDPLEENNLMIYLALNKSRSYSLFNGTIQIIGFITIVVFSILIFYFGWIFKSKIHSPLNQISEFVHDLAIGQSPEDIKTNSTEMKGIENHLNEIKGQLIDLRQNDKIIHEEVFVDILDIIDGIVQEMSKPNEFYHNITKIINNKIKKSIACSFWITKLCEGEIAPKVYRKSINYSKDQFPIEILTPIAQAVVKESILDGNIKIIRDFESDKKYRQFTDAYPFGILAIPIKVRGNIIGSVCIWKIRIPYREVFSTRTREFANYIGRVISSIIESFENEIDH